MAEGLFREMTKKNPRAFLVGSAGINATDGFPASEETIKLMKENGFDVSGHRSRRLTTEMVGAADKIFVMEKIHKDWISRFWPEAENKTALLEESMGIPDPIQRSEDFYRNVLEIIRDCVQNIAGSLSQSGGVT